MTRWIATRLLGGGLALCLLLSCPAAGRADPGPRLFGHFTQGGLVTGQAAPGSRVTLDGRPVAVTADGRFILGFGRDAARQATLRVERPNGAAVERTLAIAPRKYDIQRIDGLPKRKVTPEKRDMARIRKESGMIAKVRATASPDLLASADFAWPVHGRLSGVYGSQRILNGKPRRPHNGVDVAAPKGTPVLAPADGVVALVHPGMFFTGKTVMLDHGLGLTSVYIHMNRIAVKPGQRVTKGQPIGAVGMTGRATGPHLHWGVSWFKVPLDPALLAGPMRGK